MTKLKLTVNETKTRVCKLPEEKFDFLAYTFGRCYSPKTGRAYLGTVPSKKRVMRICEALSEMTGRDQTLLDQEMQVARLNRTMIGWANYFCLGPVSKAYRAVEKHASKRLRQWLCAKHKEVWPGTKRFPKASLHEVLSLVCLTKRTRNFPWATSWNFRTFSESRMPEIGPSGSMSGMWKRKHGAASEAPANERAGNR